MIPRHKKNSFESAAATNTCAKTLVQVTSKRCLRKFSIAYRSYSCVCVADWIDRDGDLFNFHEDDSIHFNFTLFSLRSVLNEWRKDPFLNELRKDPEVDRCTHSPPSIRIQLLASSHTHHRILTGFFGFLLSGTFFASLFMCCGCGMVWFRWLVSGLIYYYGASIIAALVRAFAHVIFISSPPPHHSLFPQYQTVSSREL